MSEGSELWETDDERQLRYLRIAVFSFLNAWEAPAGSEHRKHLSERISRLKREVGWEPQTARLREEQARSLNHAKSLQRESGRP